MTTRQAMGRGAGWSVWRVAAWGCAAALLLVPAIAMQFTHEVVWTAGDFLAAGAILLVGGAAIEGIIRLARRRSIRLIAVGAVILAVSWLWAELAVGVFTDWGS